MLDVPPQQSPYAAIIARLAPDDDPAHIEAWMRLAHGGLDHIDPVHFASEVKAASERARRVDARHSEALARSFGLSPAA
ncbi:MAG: hypothetical protein QOG15_2725 [Solirubrobacteraceae bacterium]|nr:hypothetical protein [Solirubrobacteraceae bacterium]